MLAPPQLPSFLADVFDLKPIASVPSAQEVKLVHAAIRATGSYLYTPELRDSDLPMELAQHLFDIQMACHHEKYPSGLFPNEIVYTPPSLPAHIPVKLEPVLGPPSDDELRSIHTAIRVSDNLSTNAASLFDADLNMQLSQHLFDLQLARHIQRSTRVKALDMDIQPMETLSDVTMPKSGTDDTRPSSALQQDEPHLTLQPEDNNSIKDANESLVGIEELLKEIKMVLIRSQNSLARGFNSSHINSYGHSLGVHSLINDKGETPEMHALPTLKNHYGKFHYEWPESLSMNVLARYLKFYELGSEMIEDNGELNIKPGMESEAKATLIQRLCALQI